MVIVLVHPSPALDKTANFHLKRAIARTWAKDTDDFGVTVYFVGEHKGEVVMRQPSYLLRSGSGSVIYSSNNNNQNNNNNDNSNSGRSGKEEHLRKMLIPLVVENGKADDAPGLLKVASRSNENKRFMVDASIISGLCPPLDSCYPY